MYYVGNYSLLLSLNNITRWHTRLCSIPEIRFTRIIVNVIINNVDQTTEYDAVTHGHVARSGCESRQGRWRCRCSLYRELMGVKSLFFVARSVPEAVVGWWWRTAQENTCTSNVRDDVDNARSHSTEWRRRRGELWDHQRSRPPAHTYVHALEKSYTELVKIRHL